MLRKATALWIVGLITGVPWATWHLLFRAPRDQYALLITFVLFWIFGYWGIAGPLISLVKVRTVFRAIEQATSREEIVAILRSDAARNVAIDHIATEYRIPKFIAARALNMVAERIQLADAGSPAADRPPVR